MSVTEEAPTQTWAVRKDAELVVDVCMSVEDDDVVTIITDDEHADQARVVAEVCVDRGAWPVIMNNETQVRRGRADTLFPMAPPRNLHQAMVSSDEIIIITNLEWANRFAHVSAVKESCGAQRQDRVSRARDGLVGPDRGGAAARPAARLGRDGGARRRREGARHVRQGHRLHGHDQGPAGARGRPRSRSAAR